MAIDCYTPPKAPHSGGTVTLLVSKHADLAGLKQAVEAVVLQFGTVECGLGGFDFAIRTDRAAGYPEKGKEIVQGIKALLPD